MSTCEVRKATGTQVGCDCAEPRLPLALDEQHAYLPGLLDHLFIQVSIMIPALPFTMIVSD